jgi:predicted P-loop ATPase
LTAYQWGRQLAKDAIFKLARKNRYDHIKEHFRDMVASATPLPDHQWYSLDQLLFGIDDPIARMYLPKYLIGAVTRLMKPGCPYVATPILIGGQGIGKSASANVLFGPEFVVDDLSHDLSKDDLSRLHTSFCTELSEVDGITNKADRERLKAFMTRTVDIYRPPYGVSNVKRERAFVFWGTSNSVPLNDPSGNRRFVAIDLRSKSKANPIPLNQIEQHRAAIWARAFKEYYAKTPYELNATEQSQVNANNGLFTVADSWGEKLSRKLSLHPSHTCLTVEEGFTILGILPGQQTQANQKRLREVLESLGYQSAKVTLPDGRRVNRLTRQIGQKQVPISVSHCLMGD